MIATRNLHLRGGRLRLRSDQVKGSPTRATQIKEMLLRQTGIMSVKASAITGSVLVTFDMQVTHHHEILRLLGYLGCPVDDERYGIISSDHITGQLAQSVVEFSLHQCVAGNA